MATPAHVDLGEVFHLQHPRWKHEENSEAGCLEAARHGFKSRDVDTQWCRTLAMGTHWLYPMQDDNFYDPEHKIGPDLPFSHWAYEDAQRVKARDGHYPILTARHNIKLDHEHGLFTRLEVKSATARRWTLAELDDLHTFCRAEHATVVIATLTNYPYSATILRDARRTGFDTRDLGNG